MNNEITIEQTDLSKIFGSISITDSLKSIRSLFKRSKADFFLDYKPHYQRQYVWTDVKATYLIESILLHAEIPPIITIEKGQDVEVIDGRQRCETIERFINNKLTLKLAGLDKLWYLSNKRYSNLSQDLVDRFENTKLRVITIKMASDKEINPIDQEHLTREIFKRYNLGMSPLKKEEVYKAQFLKNPLNIYFKNRINQSIPLLHQLNNLFDHKKKNIEVLMQHIRQLLMQHIVPINRYIYQRDYIVNKYYDFMSNKITEANHIEEIFNNFYKKVQFLAAIKELLKKERVLTNGLIFDCLYWALSVIENEDIPFNQINAPEFIQDLVAHIIDQIAIYTTEKNNHSQIIGNRYSYTAEFFEKKLNLSFARYIKNKEEFVAADKEHIKLQVENKKQLGLEKEYFSKVQPTSSCIIDIIDQIKRNQFVLRPPYQRTEVMNIQKASYLIESILLNLKLHPIYVYMRKDGVTEVIDGQQRLLSIIGFLGESFKNEYGKMERSKKHCFSLHLKSGPMQQLNKKKYADLPEHLKKHIRNFDLSIIEIKEEDNKHFRPEELFKRLNFKPYPIKENSFEYWNAYADKSVTTSIKALFKRNSWLYLRKEDNRMLNEELTTYLLYLEHMTPGKPDIRHMRTILRIHLGHKTNSIRLREKGHITKTLEDNSLIKGLLQTIESYEQDFIEKVKFLVFTPQEGNQKLTPEQRMDSLLSTRGKRLAMNYYLLWIMLKGISLDNIRQSAEVVTREITKAFYAIKTIKTEGEFDLVISAVWAGAKALPAEV